VTRKGRKRRGKEEERKGKKDDKGTNDRGTS
jgi:hypothetical protein